MSMTYADALEEHSAALEKNALDCSKWQIEMQAVLLAAAPPELTQAHAAAVAAYNEVQAAVTAAAARLAVHDANKPALDGVGAWARVLATLRDEASAYSAILEERQHAAAAAAAAVFMEREAAWVVLRNEVVFDNNRAFDAAQSDVGMALLNVERAKGRVGQKWNKRLLMQNALDSLKPIAVGRKQ